MGRGRRRAPAVRRRVVRRRDVLDRLHVRAAPPGGCRRAGPRLQAGRQDRAAQLDARGNDRRALPHDGPVRPAAPARRAAAAAVGQRGPRDGAVRRPRRLRHAASATSSTSPRSSNPRDYGEHFKDRYGPTIAAFANARKNGREDELQQALDAFCDEWNRGTEDDARFEKEYLVAVGRASRRGRHTALAYSTRVSSRPRPHRRGVPCSDRLRVVVRPHGTPRPPRPGGSRLAGCRGDGGRGEPRRLPARAAPGPRCTIPCRCSSSCCRPPRLGARSQCSASWPVRGSSCSAYGASGPARSRRGRARCRAERTRPSRGRA